MRLALLLSVLALAGCREGLLTDTGEPFDGPPAYVKGPATVLVGQTEDYRAEPILNAVRYRWSVRAPDLATVTPLTDTRLATVTGRKVGSVEIVVDALDASDEILARGTRTLSVAR